MAKTGNQQRTNMLHNISIPVRQSARRTPTHCTQADQLSGHISAQSGNDNDDRIRPIQLTNFGELNTHGCVRLTFSSLSHCLHFRNDALAQRTITAQRRLNGNGIQQQQHKANNAGPT